jgi:hypothetical protein
VCHQAPAAGDDVAAGVELTVDRSCSEDKSESTAPPAQSEPARSEPSRDTAPAATEPPPTSVPPTTPAPTEAPPAEPLAAATNVDLAALLADPNDCGPAVSRFASTYAGASIEFDGHVAGIAASDGTGARYDLLIRVGDSIEESGTGPNFTFRDASLADLNPGGPGLADFPALTQKVHVVLQVVAYEDSNCLFFVTPVSIQLR